MPHDAQDMIKHKSHLKGEYEQKNPWLHILANLAPCDGGIRLA